jgi:hypothetical protein
LPATALLLALMMDAQVLFLGLIGGVLYLLMDKKKAHHTTDVLGIQNVLNQKVVG